jgi:hypothetical protein
MGVIDVRAELEALYARSAGHGRVLRLEYAAGGLRGGPHERRALELTLEALKDGADVERFRSVSARLAEIGGPRCVMMPRGCSRGLAAAGRTSPCRLLRLVSQPGRGVDAPNAGGGGDAARAD